MFCMPKAWKLVAGDGAQATSPVCGDGISHPEKDGRSSLNRFHPSGIHDFLCNQPGVAQGLPRLIAEVLSGQIVSPTAAGDYALTKAEAKLVPNFAFQGQTPDEMVFGTGAKVPVDLKRSEQQRELRG